MMTAHLAGLAVAVVASGGGQPLPRPALASVRVLASQGVGQLEPARARGEVLLVLAAHGADLTLQRLSDRRRQHRSTVAVPLGGADDDITGGEIHVLDPQLATFEQSQP